MLHRLAFAFAFAFLAFATGIATAQAADAPPVVSAAVADVGRPIAERARDAALKPADVLAFSGIKANDKIAEFAPGDGYYTRMLSKLVGPKGRVYAIVPMSDVAEDVVRRDNEDMKARGETPPPYPQPPILAIQDIQDYNNVTVFWQSLMAFGGEFSVPEQLDAVFSANTYHLLHGKGLAVPSFSPFTVDMVAVSRAMYQSLKPGGTYLVSDANTKLGMGFMRVRDGRIDANGVKTEITAAGFVFDGESPALANAADDHAKPASDDSLKGAPDRFILRFKKPANAPNTDLRPGKDAIAGYYGNTSHSGIHSPVQRWVFMHPDGSYQEFGNTGTLVQQGLWYWDAAGRNCMLHQFPAEDRGSIVCHDLANSLHKNPGDEWTRIEAGRIFRMEKGYAYPPADLKNPPLD